MARPGPAEETSVAVLVASTILIGSCSARWGWSSSAHRGPKAMAPLTRYTIYRRLSVIAFYMWSPDGRLSTPVVRAAAAVAL